MVGRESDGHISVEARNFRAPEISHEFTPEEDAWFHKDLSTEQGKVDTEKIADIREQIETIGKKEVVEKDLSHESSKESIEEGDKINPGFVHAVQEKLQEGIKIVGYPSADRLMKVAGPTIVSGGIFGLSLAAGGLPVLSAAAAAGVMVGGTTFLVGECIKQLRKRNVGELMSITPVFDRPTPADDRQMLGELHLLGAKGMEKIRQAPKEKQRAVLLTEVAQALRSMHETVANDPETLADIDTFIGETDVFSEKEMTDFGFDATEVPIPTWRRPLLEAADKLQKVLSGRFRALASPRKAKPVFKIQFTRKQLANVVESGMLDRIISLDNG